MKLINDPQLLTQREAATLLKCSERTVIRLRMAGEIPYIPGRPVKIRLVAILDYLERKECQSQDSLEMKRKISSRSNGQRGTTTRAGSCLKSSQQGALLGLKQRLFSTRS